MRNSSRREKAIARLDPQLQQAIAVFDAFVDEQKQKSVYTFASKVQGWEVYLVVETPQLEIASKGFSVKMTGSIDKTIRAAIAYNNIVNGNGNADSSPAVPMLKNKINTLENTVTDLKKKIVDRDTILSKRVSEIRELKKAIGFLEKWINQGIRLVEQLPAIDNRQILKLRKVS